MDVYIRSLGAFLPPQVVTNDDIVARTGGTAQWIVEHTGILERRFVAPGMTNSKMAEHAAREALSVGQLAAGDLDALVFATLSPDAGFPGNGVFLQRHLGIPGVPALDVRNQCSGFLYGLSITKAWLSSCAFENVLLVGS